MQRIGNYGESWSPMPRRNTAQRRIIDTIWFETYFGNDCTALNFINITISNKTYKKSTKENRKIQWMQPSVCWHCENGILFKNIRTKPTDVISVATKMSIFYKAIHICKSRVGRSIKIKTSQYQPHWRLMLSLRQNRFHWL